MELLQLAADAGTLADTVTAFIKRCNDELKEKTVYDAWLHRGGGMSFDEYRIKCGLMEAQNEAAAVDAVHASAAILADFVPDDQ